MVVTAKDVMERLSNTGLISMVEDSRSSKVYGKSHLVRMLHTELWMMRGRHNVANVYVLLETLCTDTGIGGSPKEEVRFDTLFENIAVVALDSNNKIVERVNLINETTQVGDITSCQHFKQRKFRGMDIACTDNFYVLITEVVSSRLDYFKGLKILVRESI